MASCWTPTGRSWRARAASVAASLVLATVAPSAMAQQPAPAADTKAAEDRRIALYREGVGAAAAGQWADARDRFRQVLAIRSSPKVLFSLAQAEEHLGQVASAQADYGRALDGARAAGEAEVVTAAGQAQRAMESRVPYVRVVVSGASDAHATLDGQPIAVGASVAVDPGAHQLVVSAPGMVDVTTSVAIGEMQKLDVPVTMTAAAGTAVQPAPPAPTPPQPVVAASPAGPEATPSTTSSAVPWRTIGLVAAGAGVVSLGAGAAFGLVAKSKNDQSNSSGCNGDNCTAAAASTRRDALGAANVSTVLFVVGGVLAAGGLALWLVSPSGDGAGVAVSPVALGGGGGVVVAAGW
jgi:hypothetical protein